MDTYQFAANTQNHKTPLDSKETIQDLSSTETRLVLVHFAFNGFSLNFQGPEPFQLAYQHTKPVDGDLTFLNPNVNISNWKDKTHMEGYYFPRGVDEDVDRARSLLDERRRLYNEESGFTPNKTAYLHQDGFLPKSLTVEGRVVNDSTYQTLDEFLKDEGSIADELIGNPFFGLGTDLDPFFKRFKQFNGWNKE